MNEIITFTSPEFHVRTVDFNGEIFFVGKDVAHILGYAETSNMRKLLDKADYIEINPNSPQYSGFVQNGSMLEPNPNIHRMLLINESGLYQAIFGSTLARAKEFKRWVTSEVLPAIRKTGGYQKPMTQLEMIAAMAQELVKTEKRIENTEKCIVNQGKQIEGIRDIVGINPVNWRNTTTLLVNKMAKILGGNEYIHDIRIESYNLLEKRMGVDLKARLLNCHKRMSYNGATKTAIDKITKLDVIGNDKKLIEGYIAIIKEMAIKYGADLQV